MRNISFFLTQDQIRNRTKTVTRRAGWQHAQAGMILRGVVKGQGLKKGEAIEPLCIIEIVSCKVEPLSLMTDKLGYGNREVIAEGFPQMTPKEFVEMFCEHNQIEPQALVRRIEFKYREDLWAIHQTGKLNLDQGKNLEIPNQKEPIMARPKKQTENNQPAMDEGQVLSEKDQVDKAFAGLTPKRSETQDEPQPLELAAAELASTKVLSMPAKPMYVEDLDADNEGQSFQLCIFQEYTEAEFAAKGKELAALDTEGMLLDKEMKEVMKEWKEKIAAVEARRMAMSANINAKGEEKDIECRKRVNEETGVATIYNIETLQIVEQRKLDASELQTEMLFKKANTSKTVPAGAKVVKGNFPKNQVLGATEKEDSAMDAANEAALKALAEEQE